MLGWVNRLGGAVFGLLLGAITCGALLAAWVKFFGIGETITLAVVNPTGWTQGVPGEETYRISFQFAETQPLADDPGWQNEGGISELLSYDETKNLWVKLETPTATGATAEQTAQVIIPDFAIDA